MKYFFVKDNRPMMAKPMQETWISWFHCVNIFHKIYWQEHNNMQPNQRPVRFLILKISRKNWLHFVKNCWNEINFTKNSGNTFKISHIEAQKMDLKIFSESFDKWNFVDTVLPQQVSLNFKTKYGIETHTKFYLRISVKTNFFCSKRPKKVL